VNKLRPYSLIGSGIGPVSSWHSHWPTRSRLGWRSHRPPCAPHWPRGVALSISALSLARRRRWRRRLVGAKTTKVTGSGPRCSRLPCCVPLRRSGLLPAPLQMKCEHCTRKVGATVGTGNWGGRRSERRVEARGWRSGLGWGLGRGRCLGSGISGDPGPGLGSRPSHVSRPPRAAPGLRTDCRPSVGQWVWVAEDAAASSSLARAPGTWRLMERSETL
jgi:hypothetical protein